APAGAAAAAAVAVAGRLGPLDPHVVGDDHVERLRQVDAVAVPLLAGLAAEGVAELVADHRDRLVHLAVAPELKGHAVAAGHHRLELDLGAAHRVADHAGLAVGADRGELDHRVVRPADLDDHPALPDSFHDGGLAQLLGPHQGGRRSDVALARLRLRGRPVVVAAAGAGDAVAAVEHVVPQLDHQPA